MATLSDLSMAEVHEHYALRERVHRQLRELFEAGNVIEFVRLALGIDNRAGNYSASEHLMGPRILAAGGAEREVFELATQIEDNQIVNRLPMIIYERSIANLKISIGSEIAMMMKPDRHWVGNKRTIWAHLLIRHRMVEARANEALRLFFARDDDSEMAYPIWRDIYLSVGPDLTTLGQRASEVARAQGMEPGGAGYLWPDAVANYLFDRYARG